jgi:putative tryptophan/tyrosine transport system substrate-binding protein
VQRLSQLGWTEGRNLQIENRWAAGESERYGKYAAELVALAPDVVLASGNQSVAALHQATRILPIVFANVIDPVGSGFVSSLARPGGNVTGFSLAEFGASGKLVELLREIAPRVTRAGVLRDPISPASLSELAAMQAVAPLVGIELTPVDVQDVQEIAHAFEAFERGQTAVVGLIVPPSPMAARHRDLIITLAARHRLPAVYGLRFYTVAGGLMSYGGSTATLYQLAAEYVDRRACEAAPFHHSTRQCDSRTVVCRARSAVRCASPADRGVAAGCQGRSGCAARSSGISGRTSGTRMVSRENNTH